MNSITEKMGFYLPLSDPGKTDRLSGDSAGFGSVNLSESMCWQQAVVV